MVQLYIAGDEEDAASQFSHRSGTEDMKLLLVTLCAVGCALGEAPYPAAGVRPQGTLLEYGEPAEHGSTLHSTDVEDLAMLAENLRQEQGSSVGSYHVFLNDGRLQNVHYTTASLRNGQQWNSGLQQYSGQFQNQVSHVDNNRINHNVETSRLQQDYLPPQLNRPRNGDYHQFGQQQLNGQYFQQYSPLAQEYGLPESQLDRAQDELQQQQIQLLEQRQQQLEQQQQELRQQQEELRSASLRYNADPITSQDYSYRTPTRVLRYAPEY